MHIPKYKDLSKKEYIKIINNFKTCQKMLEMLATTQLEFIEQNQKLATLLSDTHGIQCKMALSILNIVKKPDIKLVK